MYSLLYIDTQGQHRVEAKCFLKALMPTCQDEHPGSGDLSLLSPPAHAQELSPCSFCSSLQVSPLSLVHTGLLGS